MLEHTLSSLIHGVTCWSSLFSGHYQASVLKTDFRKQNKFDKRLEMLASQLSLINATLYVYIFSRFHVKW